MQRKTKPRYIIVTDFNELYAKDTKTLERLAIKIEELPQNFSFFLAWNNIEKVDYEKKIQWISKPLRGFLEYMMS